MERPFSIRLTQELQDHVSALAEERQITLASAVRAMLLQHLGLPEDGLVRAYSLDQWIEALRPMVLGFECLTPRDTNTLLQRTREYSLGKQNWRRKKLTQALQKLGFRKQSIRDGQLIRRVFVRSDVKDPMRAYLERRAAQVFPLKTGRVRLGRPGAFSDENIREIRRLCAEKVLTKGQIAEKFGTSSSNVYAIEKGNTYKYVSMPEGDAYRKAQEAAISGFLERLGVRSEARGLGDHCSDADIRHICQMVELGISQVSLALHYAVAQQTVSRFVNGIRRRDPLEMADHV